MLKYWKEYEGHSYTIAGKNKKFDTTIYTFDIETTSYLVLDGKVYNSIEYLKMTKKEQERCLKQSTMYIWTLGINDTVYYGRTWQDLQAMMLKINFYSPVRKYIYVHNLSFEFEYLKSVFLFKNVKARKSHKVRSADLVMYPVTFKCTYIMTNCALEKLPEQYNLDIYKKVGDLDYNKNRNSLTELTEKEQAYCEYDCLVLYKYLLKEIEEYGDLQKIPNTSTGKVRRELHFKIDNDNDYKQKTSRSINIDGKVYNMLTEGFSGGYTHASWLYADEILPNITSYDFTSSYPYCLCCFKYPSTIFRECNITNLDNMLPEFAYIMRIKLFNICSQQFNTFLSKNKCRKIRGGKYDNGRILKADYLETTITDVDWQYLQKAYNIQKENYEIIDIYYSIYDYLPKQLIEFILEKYVEKTKLKNVAGKEYAYARSKALFNAIYGMCVTNTICANVTYDNDLGWDEKELTNEQILKKLYSEKKKAFLSFAWGVWCTAYARNNLIQNILKLDDHVAYCDTDSCKLTEGFDKKVILNYNKNVVERIKQVCKDLNIEYEKFEPEDIEGNKHLLGVFDLDGEYKEFITQGAKKYAYIKQVKKSKVKKGANVIKDYGASCDVLEITVSGVPKKGARQLKSLEDFKDDLEFTYENTNKNVLFYCEEQIPVDLTDYQGNTIKVTDKSGCCLVPTTYTLKKSLEYATLLDEESTERAVYIE